MLLHNAQENDNNFRFADFHFVPIQQHVSYILPLKKNKLL